MLASVLLALGALSASERPVSFLVVITDDQRNDMLSCAGHPVLKTPQMDALAERGVRFTNAFVTTPICAASRASILASRYEREHRFNFGRPPISEALTDDSWPVRLRSAGWRTGHIGKWGMKTTVRPRDLYDTFAPLSAPYWKTPKKATRRHVTNITGDLSIEFLDELESDEPFALTVSFNAPHAEDSHPDQYIWPDEESALYADDEIARPTLATEGAFRALPEFLQSAMGRKRWHWRFDTEEKRVRMTRGHFRMISGVDRNLGRIVERLEELDRAEDTVILLMGDNGYFLGERGLAGKWLIYEEAIRVPLILVDPRAQEAHRGRAIEPMALNIDIGPTVLDLAGLKVPAGYQGESLAPWIEGKAESWRTDFMVEHHTPNDLLPKHRGVRGERFAYSLFYELDPPFELLFDLENDPLQLRNLADDPEYREALIAMRERTEAFAVRETAELEPVDLLAAGQENPLATGSTPEFTWRVFSPALAGAEPSAYRLLVASSQAKLDANVGDLWDSGRAPVRPSKPTRYAGSPLAPGQKAFWKVRSYDGEGWASRWSPSARFQVAATPSDD